MPRILAALLLTILCFAGGCATSGGSGGATAAGGRSDSEITTAIEDAFKQDDLLGSAGISVNTDQGVVTLSGNVPSARAYNRALFLAGQVPGVRRPVLATGLTYPR
jgi:hyperosmotically inducible protein